METTGRIQRLLANRFTTHQAPWREPFHDAWLAAVGDEPEIRLAKAICAQWLGARLVVQPDELIVGRLELRSIVRWDFNYAVQFDQALFKERLAQAEDSERAYLLEMQDTWRGRTTGDLMAKAILPQELPLMRHHGPSAPGCHSSPLLIRLAEEGTIGLRRRVQASRTAHAGQPGCERPAWYVAQEILLDGIDAFALAYARVVEEEAQLARDPLRERELREIAARCARVLSQPAASFADALQAYWLITVLHRPDSPGRFDQDLWPWLKRDLAAGQITLAQAQELVDCVWIKFAQNRCWSLTLGGQTPDGTDATNDLSYLCLDSLRRLRTDAPNVEVRLHHGTPERLLRESCTLLAEGLSMPALVNDEPVIQAMRQRGIAPEHARDYTLVGCTQVVSRGRCSGAYEALILNVAKCLELALHDGYDTYSQQQMGPHSGTTAELRSYADLERAWTVQLDWAIDKLVDAINRQYAVIGEHYPDLLKSMLIEGCLEQGKDYRHGGALYTEGLTDVLGITNVSDSLLAVKQLVFDEQRLSLAGLTAALDADWEGCESLRQECLNRVPKFGNGQVEADDLTVQIFKQINDAFAVQEKLYGRHWGIDVIGWTGSVYWGQRTGATPDGRRRGAALSDSVGASQGRDKAGVTALLRSVSKLPNASCHGILALNLRFGGSTFAGSDGVEKMVQLVNAAMALGLQQVQVNVVSAEILKAAQLEPAACESLMVRIGGFSTYFNWLSKEHQDDIIARTEHELA
ncbi:MAG: pyruvate formate lyase family protein [Anaerolineae bacterium]